VIERKPLDSLPAQDTKNQDQIDRMALEKAEAEREQEERRKKEQQLLDDQERLSQMERERQQQLEDIRKMREAAEKTRKAEELKLAQLMDKQKQQADDAERAVAQAEEAAEQEQQQAGNEGTDNDLRARYVLALQTAVTNGWLRPETAQAGLRCTVRIVQIPGGEVLSATVVSPCNGDDMTRRSIEAAVLRAQPLPYQGYETVFARSIDFNFSYDG
jgi:colicin import membrane protein